MTPEILSEQAAEDYLNSLQTSPNNDVPQTDIAPTSIEEHTIKQNERIIKAADRLLLDRLEDGDGSLRITDIVSAKDSAFKNNRALQGNNDDILQLIPSVINIQINR